MMAIQGRAGRTALFLIPAIAVLCIAVHTTLAQRAGTCMQSSAQLSNTLKPVVFPVPVQFDTNSPQSICYVAEFLDCTNPPLCTNRTTWRWIYGATDKASCEYLNMDPNAYRNVSCCSQTNCNAPNATFDAETVILPSDPARGK